MIRTNTQSIQKANRGGADSRIPITRSAGMCKALAKCARTVFGVKTWAYLSDLLGISERSAKGRMSCEREFTADEIATLLRSDHGLQFLVTLMGDAQPRWWVAIRRVCVLGSVAERRAADLRMLQRLSHADRSTAIAMPAAVLLSDAEFYGAVLQGCDALAARGASDRAVDRR